MHLAGSSNSSARNVKFSFTCVLAALTMLAARAGAQSVRGGMCGMPGIAADSSAVEHAPLRRWSFGAWFAGGYHEPIKTRVGHREDRALYLAGVSASHMLRQWTSADISFTPTVLPVMIATANREYAPVVYDGGGTVLVPYKKTAFGVGLIPIAVEVTLRLSDRTGIVLGGGGGASYFDRRIPDPDETRFNFLADGHTGLYLRSSMGTASVGFRLQHISNGDTGRVNPGLDTRMLYIGFQR